MNGKGVSRAANPSPARIMSTSEEQKHADAVWRVVGEHLAIATGATFTNSAYFARALRQAVRAEIAAAQATDDE